MWYILGTMEASVALSLLPPKKGPCAARYLSTICRRGGVRVGEVCNLLLPSDLDRL
jgi:hypothetical protein